MNNYVLKVRQIRRAKDLTQRELAKKMNISHQAISQIENGKITPTLDRLVEMAKILDVTLDELVEFKKIHSEYSEELSNIK
jgi:transcriptional regulator with XRE-family HTH domain